MTTTMTTALTETATVKIIMWTTMTINYVNSNYDDDEDDDNNGKQQTHEQ